MGLLYPKQRYELIAPSPTAKIALVNKFIGQINILFKKYLNLLDEGNSFSPYQKTFCRRKRRNSNNKIVFGAK